MILTALSPDRVHYKPVRPWNSSSFALFVRVCSSYILLYISTNYQFLTLAFLINATSEFSTLWSFYFTTRQNFIVIHIGRIYRRCVEFCLHDSISPWIGRKRCGERRSLVTSIFSFSHNVLIFFSGLLKLYFYFTSVWNYFLATNANLSILLSGNYAGALAEIVG